MATKNKAPKKGAGTRGAIIARAEFQEFVS